MTLPADLHDPKSRSAISLERLLVVEGRDAFRFFIKLVRELGLDQTVEVRNFGGIDDLADYLKLLSLISGFDRVEAVGVARDSETDPAQAFQKVASAITSAGWTAPQTVAVPSTGSPATIIYLLPDAANPGMLESLLWRSLTGNPLVDCIEDYLKCAEAATGSPVANRDKSRVHSFIAVQKKPQYQLGQAVADRYFPLDSPVFDDVKAFLAILAGISG